MTQRNYLPWLKFHDIFRRGNSGCSEKAYYYHCHKNPLEIGSWVSAESIGDWIRDSPKYTPWCHIHRFRPHLYSMTVIMVSGIMNDVASTRRCKLRCTNWIACLVFSSQQQKKNKKRVTTLSQYYRCANTKNMVDATTKWSTRQATFLLTFK